MDDLAMAAEDMELRCVLAVVRHGDRTPKQKMKMVVNQARMPSLYTTHAYIKRGMRLASEFLIATRTLDGLQSMLRNRKSSAHQRARLWSPPHAWPA